MAVMGRGNWWWPGQRATMVYEGSVSIRDIRDEKQAVGTFDDHASAARLADIEAASHLKQHESGPGRIHHAADVTPTVVVEVPSWLSVP